MGSNLLRQHGRHIVAKGMDIAQNEGADNTHHADRLFFLISLRTRGTKSLGTGISVVASA